LFGGNLIIHQRSNSEWLELLQLGMYSIKILMKEESLQRLNEESPDESRDPSRPA
jgi:hypothetical protein